MQTDRRVSRWLNGVCLALALGTVGAVGIWLMAHERTRRMVLAPNPGNAFQVGVRGAVFAERGGDFAGAIRRWESAWALRPASPAVRVGLARALLFGGRRERAWDVYRELVVGDLSRGRVPPGGADALAWYGDLAQAHHDGTADAAYRMALGTHEIGGDRPPQAIPSEGPGLAAAAHLRAGDNLRKVSSTQWAMPEDVAAAIRHYRRATELTPKSAEAWCSLAEAMADAGRPGEALALLDGFRQTAHGPDLALAVRRERALRDGSRRIRRPLRALPNGRSRTLPLPKR